MSCFCNKNLILTIDFYNKFRAMWMVKNCWFCYFCITETINRLLTV